MFTRVLDEGPLNAKIVLIGDHPDKNALEKGRPLGGYTGNKFEWLWLNVGLKRTDFYLTNVLDYLPRNIDKVSREEMENAFAMLWDRLRKLEGPLVICPVGNYALYAMTKQGKISWHRQDGRVERAGIGDWRGSILEIELNGRSVRLIPTLHTEKLRSSPRLEKRARHDWERIAQALFNQGNREVRYVYANPLAL